MRIAVASGKGGAGKTSLVVNLARLAADEGPVRVLDCDVEEPNVHLFLDGTPSERREVSMPVPVIDAAKCSGCGKCARFCAFHALVCLGEAPMLFADLCHSCGGCMRLCPHKAISEASRRIGDVGVWHRDAMTLIEGRLDVGISSPAPLVRAVKAEVGSGAGAADGWTLIDAPPGTSCPAMAAMAGCDFVLLAAEATRFGLNDLGLIADAVRTLKIPFAVAVNRTVPGRTLVEDYCRGEGIAILAAIPEDRRIAEAYARGRLIIEALPAYRPLFAALWQSLRVRAEEEGRAA